MPRHLIIKNGKYVDVQTVPNEIFKGIAARDLDPGDTFETFQQEKKIICKVLSKEPHEDGSVCILSVEV